MIYTPDTQKYLELFRTQTGQLPSPEALVKMRRASTVDDAKQILMSFGEGVQPEMVEDKKEAAKPVKGVKPGMAAGGGKPAVSNMGGVSDHTETIPQQSDTVKVKGGIDHRWVRNILRWVFVIIGVAAAIRGGSIIFEFFQRIGWSEFISILMVIVIAGISNLGPVAAELLWPMVRKKKNIMLFIVCIIATGFAIYTSVNVTISELSAARAEVSDAVSVDQAIINRAIGNLKDKESEIKRIEEQIKSLQEDKNALRQELPKHEPASAAYNRVYWRIAELEKAISGLSKQAGDLGDLLPGLRSEASKTVKTSQAHDTETMGYGLAGLLEIAGPLSVALWAFL